MGTLDIAKVYQPLFNLMVTEHNLILTISEMDEIIIQCRVVDHLAVELIKQIKPE